MFNNLTEKELDAANGLIRHGLAKAGKALQMILNTPVVVNPVQLGDDNLEDTPEYSTKTKDKRTHLLKTELVGDLKGFCHLILSQEEVEKIQNHCLPANIMNENTPQNRLMKLEHLTEIDNIVAGTVITEFANYLNLKVYGNVPSLHIMHAEEVNKYIHAEAVVYSSSNYFKAILQAADLHISADFIWLFQDNFANCIKEFSQSDRRVEIAQ